MTKIEKHELAIELIEATKLYEKFVCGTESTIKRFNEMGFSSMIKHYEHTLDIQNRVIERLKLRYNNISFEKI